MYYDKIIEKHPWLQEKKHKAIISSDVDGLLSGLLVSTFLDWEIVGYYDSENLLIKENTTCAECIFLDVEIFRSNIRSLGHHIIIFDKNKIPHDFNEKTKLLLNPNIERNFDRLHNYTNKYPFGAVHLLLKAMKISSYYSKDVTPLLFCDGFWKIYKKYNKNVREWIEYLGFQDQDWWRHIEEESYGSILKSVNNFITKMNIITEGEYGHLDLNNFNKKQLFDLIKLFDDYLSWGLDLNNWCTDKLKLIKFHRYFMNLYDIEDFEKFWKENPFSVSTYYRNKISYTVEGTNKLP